MSRMADLPRKYLRQKWECCELKDKLLGSLVTFSVCLEVGAALLSCGRRSIEQLRVMYRKIEGRGCGTL